MSRWPGRVAGEVRSLAARSAGAAREIKALIGESVDKVDVGARQVREAGASMDEIVTRVQRVTQLIGEVSSATAEQTSGIGQVGDAVTQLDEVTQQNAALVEESAAAAESLRQQAAKLTELVSVFKLGADETLTASAAAVSGTAVPPAPPRSKGAPPSSMKTNAAPKSTEASGAMAGAAAAEWTSF